MSSAMNADFGGKTFKLKKLSFEGTWECNGGVTTYKDLTLKWLIDDTNKNHKFKDTDTLETSWNIQGEDYLTHNGVPKDGDFKTILTKLFT